MVFHISLEVQLVLLARYVLCKGLIEIFHSPFLYRILWRHPYPFACWPVETADGLLLRVCLGFDHWLFFLRLKLLVFQPAKKKTIKKNEWNEMELYYSTVLRERLWHDLTVNYVLYVLWELPRAIPPLSHTSGSLEQITYLAPACLATSSYDSTGTICPESRMRYTAMVILRLTSIFSGL